MKGKPAWARGMHLHVHSRSHCDFLFTSTFLCPSSKHSESLQELRLCPCISKGLSIGIRWGYFPMARCPEIPFGSVCEYSRSNGKVSGGNSSPHGGYGEKNGTVFPNSTRLEKARNWANHTALQQGVLRPRPRPVLAPEQVTALGCGSPNG